MPGIIQQLTGEETREPSNATGAAAARAGWSHRRRDVPGGWLRPTALGPVDGLVRGDYSAPMTLKSWLTKMWCGQLTPMVWTSYSPLPSCTTRSTMPPG